MSKARQKGTAAETAVVRYLQERGFLYAERRALHGVNDKGDIAGVPGVVFEIKDQKTAEWAAWLDELALEMRNAHAPIGAVIRKRKGTTQVGEWYACMPVSVFVDLIEDAYTLEANNRSTRFDEFDRHKRNTVDL